MRKRRAWLIAVAGILLVAGVAGWLLLTPPALSFAGPGAVSLSAYRGPSPVGVPEELRSSDWVTRGGSLTRAGDWGVCHPRGGGPGFAGGVAFQPPFGVLSSPNITADRETGIGAWSDADFLRAVHRGIAKDGE